MADCMHLLCEASTSEGYGWEGDQTGGEVHAYFWYNSVAGGWGHIYRFDDDHSEYRDKLAQAQQDTVLCGYVGYGYAGNDFSSPNSPKSFMRAMMAAAMGIDYDAWKATGFHYIDANGKQWYAQGKVYPEKWNPYAVKHECSAHCSSSVYANFVRVTQFWYHAITFLGKTYIYADRAMNYNYSIPTAGSGVSQDFYETLCSGKEIGPVRAYYGKVVVRCDFEPVVEYVPITDIYTLDAETEAALKEKTVKIMHITNTLGGGMNYTYTTTVEKFYHTVNGSTVYYRDTENRYLYTTLYTYKVEPCMESYIAAEDGIKLYKKVFENGEFVYYEDKESGKTPYTVYPMAKSCNFTEAYTEKKIGETTYKLDGRCLLSYNSTKTYNGNDGISLKLSYPVNGTESEKNAWVSSCVAYNKNFSGNFLPYIAFDNDGYAFSIGEISGQELGNSSTVTNDYEGSNAEKDGDYLRTIKKTMRYEPAYSQHYTTNTKLDFTDRKIFSVVTATSTTTTDTVTLYYPSTENGYHAVVFPTGSTTKTFGFVENTTGITATAFPRTITVDGVKKIDPVFPFVKVDFVSNITAVTNTNGDITGYTFTYNSKTYSFDATKLKENPYYRNSFTLSGNYYNVYVYKSDSTTTNAYIEDWSEVSSATDSDGDGVNEFTFKDSKKWYTVKLSDGEFAGTTVMPDGWSLFGGDVDFDADDTGDSASMDDNDEIIQMTQLNRILEPTNMLRGDIIATRKWKEGKTSGGHMSLWC